eukprot:12742265-Ditylum_brightwellii.AAC.1
MTCHSFVVAAAVLIGNMRVVTVTVIIASNGKSVHLMVAFFLAAAVNFQRTKHVKSINSYLFCLFFFLFAYARLAR